MSAYPCLNLTSSQQNQNRNCGCGGWAHAVQLEHDLTELKASHENLLAGLHQQIESLKQKNRGEGRRRRGRGEEREGDVGGIKEGMRGKK